MIVTLQDYMNTYGCCCSGGRAFCREHGLDWNNFRKNGIDVDVLKQFDHARVKAIIDTALNRKKMGSDSDNAK